jgi:hypothetical protein
VDSYKSSLIRKLKFKSKEVSSELKDAKFLYNQAVGDFCIAIDFYCSTMEIDNPLESIAKNVNEEEKEELNNNFKKLFRKISLLTHPDKTQDEDSRDILEDAVEAKKSKDTSSLTSIAHDLKIDLSNLDYDSIDLLEESIKKSEQEILNIHNSYPWAWYYAPENKKDPILISFIQNNV